MVIEDLERMDKTDRVVAFGKYMRDSENLKYEFKSALVDIRKIFFINNDLVDSDIISIKKDAIFTTKSCDNTQFGHCNFVEKNKYSSALLLPKYEIYYNKEKIDIKGISDTAYDRLEVIINWLKELFEVIEEKGVSVALSKTISLYDNYKHKKLPDGFYVTFNSASSFVFHDISELAEDATNMDVIDIRFNLEHLLIPVIEILINAYSKELKRR